MSRWCVPHDPAGPAPVRPTTSYAVLGLLSLRSWTTYELAKQVRRSLNWFWPRAERRLYEEPKRLVADGLATSTVEHTGRRPRTVYTITPEGRAALQDWLGRAASPSTTESEAVLKVFFSDAGTVDQLRGTLAAMEREAVDRLAELARMAGQGIEQTSPFPRRAHLSALTMHLQIEQEATLLRWSRWAQEQVERWPSTTDPGEWDPRAVLQEALVRAERAGQA
jgi:PadR family transcriptional regulator, regulatory protein AphA